MQLMRTFKKLKYLWVLVECLRVGREVLFPVKQKMIEIWGKSKIKVFGYKTSRRELQVFEVIFHLPGGPGMAF